MAEEEVALHFDGDLPDDLSEQGDGEQAPNVGLGEDWQDAESDDGEGQAVGEVFIKAEPTNVAIKELLDTSKYPGAMDRAIKISNLDFAITNEDLAVYTCMQNWFRSIKPTWTKECEQSRLFSVISHVLVNGKEAAVGVADLPDGARAFTNQLQESRSNESWQRLFQNNSRKSMAVERLRSATCEIELGSGKNSGTKWRVWNKIRKLFPEYFMAWICADRINNCSARIAGPLKGDKDKELFPEGIESVWGVFDDKNSGLSIAGMDGLLKLNEDGVTGLTRIAIQYVLNSLIVAERAVVEEAALKTVFSPIARELVTLLPDTITSPKELDNYGCFKDRAAMLSMMLACSEIETIKSCASMVKTLLLRAPGDNGTIQKIVQIASVLTGHDLKDALDNPEAANNTPVVYSKISTTNLGSLAAVWLAKNRFSYGDLLTAGLEGTAALVALSRVAPFIQAVISFSARKAMGNLGVGASITCEDVSSVFFEYALVLVQQTPGFVDIGKSQMLTDLDQQLATTLFYGALNSETFAKGEASTYITDVIKGRAEGLEADPVVHHAVRHKPGKIPVNSGE